ncbi:hypothetical protein [Smaragdicoccus niigatensis]|uniref:hypothetical protein n=1 Tax=Smaragdicoccus niigatensis TaxID=359359 RepID=UPI0012DF2128|nr:hypothetical protein [Smaragdicoccus niigatensis]
MAATVLTVHPAPVPETAADPSVTLAADSQGLGGLISGFLNMITCLGTGSAGGSCPGAAGDPGAPQTLPPPATTQVVDDTGGDTSTAAPTTTTTTAPTTTTASTQTSTSTTITTTTTTTTTAPNSADCPDVVRLDANTMTADEIIPKVEQLDANCPNTKTTVVGHSFGAARVSDVAEHFGSGYTGKTKFVMNAPPGNGQRGAFPANTIMNCVYADPVCDKAHGSPLTYLNHMPENYPLSFDNNAPGFNLIMPDGTIQRPYD